VTVDVMPLLAQMLLACPDPQVWEMLLISACTPLDVWLL
jgi:hypothetical protein